MGLVAFGPFHKDRIIIFLCAAADHTHRQFDSKCVLHNLASIEQVPDFKDHPDATSNQSRPDNRIQEVGRIERADGLNLSGDSGGLCWGMHTRHAVKQ